MTESVRIERIGDATLYLGDCLEILPTLGKVDAVVTDPPYGINYAKMISGVKADVGKLNKNRWQKYESFDWDEDRPSPDTFRAILNVSDTAIIWGGNYFADLLPPSMQWLIWDKCQTFSLADFEMAWSSQHRAARIFRYSRPEALQDGRHHPTQKPIALMKWCLSHIPNAHTVLDPFMGSGTTGVACVKLGRKFIGIEIEEKYFDIAYKRIKDAYDQPDMFIEPPIKPVQEGLLL